MTARLSACVLVLATAASAARADSVYVIEQLVVGVISAPGSEGQRIATIKSGDRLELIERKGDEAHVRLTNGTEGWVKAAYVSAEQPLQHRLNDRTAEVERLKQDVSRLESELAAARVAASNAGTGAAANTPGEGPSERPGPAGASAASHEPSVFLAQPDQPGRPLWEWVLGTSAVMLLLGFVLGWRVLDRRIRRKFGGLRIY